MTRKKSKLTLQVAKRRKSSANAINTDLNAPFTLKRKFKASPFKPSPLKSPFRSPLYKAYPVYKKRKPCAARTLFEVRESQNTNIEEPIESSLLFTDNSFDDLPSTSTSDTTSSSLSNIAKCSPFQAQESSDNSETLINNKVDIQLTSDSETTLPLTSNIATCLDCEQQPFAYDTTPQSEANNNDETLNILQDVIQILTREKRLDQVILTFFKQVKENRFPLNNISFLLWCEVVQWYECRTTTRMRYSEETKIFWKLGYRLFGEKFVNFMGGLKSHGESVLKLSAPGQYSPSSSDVNFIIPNPKILRAFDPFNVQGERRPGMYQDIMDVLNRCLTNRSACLTFDGKKLKQGLSHDSGDVDLLGFESESTLEQRKFKLQENLIEVKDFQQDLLSLNKDDINIKLMPLSNKTKVKFLLLEKLQQLSDSIFAVKDLKKKKEYCKLKLIEKGGETDWRKSKYVYAISAVIAFLYDIENFLKQARYVTDRISRCVAILNDTNFVLGETVNLASMDTYLELSPSSMTQECTRFVKQRSEQWHELRASAKVTASTLFGALGFDGLNKMKNHFDKVICGVPEKEPTPDVKAAMKHGEINEVNAVATIVGKIAPVFEPDAIFCEEGSVKINTKDGDVFMVISPDGSLRRDKALQSTYAAIEIKCPVNSVHTYFPPRYLLQCISQIEALNVEYLLYASWTKDDTVVFRVNRDKGLFQRAMVLAQELYGTKSRKRPTKLTDTQKQLKEEIYNKSRQVTMLGRFSSVKSGNRENIYDNESFTIKDTVKLLEDINETTANFYELKRERASEAVVCLVADLDRSWQNDQIRSAPVAWFPKGYSLTTEVLRSIVEQVHTQCHESGIHIPCSSFDGQWHMIAVRSVDGKPLTLLQLQKDLWKEVTKMQKKELIDEFKSLNKSPKWQYVEQKVKKETARNQVFHVIEAFSSQNRLPKYKGLKEPNLSEPVDVENAVTEHKTLAESLPPAVQQAANIDETVLSMCNVDNVHEQSIFSYNINEEDWAEQLEELQYEVDYNGCDSPVTRETDVIYEQEEFSTININQLDKPKESSQLTHEDMSCILALFSVTKNCNKKNKWDHVTCADLLKYFETEDTLKQFLDVELRAIVQYCTLPEKIKRLCN